MEQTQMRMICVRAGVKTLASEYLGRRGSHDFLVPSLHRRWTKSDNGFIQVWAQVKQFLPSDSRGDFGQAPNDCTCCSAPSWNGGEEGRGDLCHVHPIGPLPKASEDSQGRRQGDLWVVCRQRQEKGISRAFQDGDPGFEFCLEGNAEGYGWEDGCFNKYTQERQAVSVTCTHLY